MQIPRTTSWLLALLAALQGAALPVCAGDELAGQPGAFLRMGVGARALGMGSAYVAFADDATSVYWNPAAIARKPCIQMGAMFSRLPLDQRHNFLSVAGPGRFAAWGISWIGFGVTGIEARSSNTLAPDYSVGLDSASPESKRAAATRSLLIMYSATPKMRFW